MLGPRKTEEKMSASTTTTIYKVGNPTSWLVQKEKIKSLAKAATKSATLLMMTRMRKNTEQFMCVCSLDFDYNTHPESESEN